MISNYCHHLFIIRWSAAKRRPASTSWSRWTALWTSSHTWFSSSTIHLSSSLGFGLNASNFIKYIDYLDPGQTICATSTPSLCSPLWLGAVLEKWKKFHLNFNGWLPSQIWISVNLFGFLWKSSFLYQSDDSERKLQHCYRCLFNGMICCTLFSKGVYDFANTVGINLFLWPSFPSATSLCVTQSFVTTERKRRCHFYPTLSILSQK